jgi:hypothetical protein
MVVYFKSSSATTIYCVVFTIPKTLFEKQLIMLKAHIIVILLFYPSIEEIFHKLLKSCCF